MTPRPFILSAALIGGTITAGMVLRRVPMELPDAIVKHGGSILWAAMIYAIVSTLRGQWSPGQNIAVATVVAFAVELSQLYHQPAIDAFRTTRAGALLLGRVFSVVDLLVYGLAVMLAAIGDRAMRRWIARRLP
jgi:hypothetical protein